MSCDVRSPGLTCPPCSMPTHTRKLFIHHWGQVTCSSTIPGSSITTGLSPVVSQGALLGKRTSGNWAGCSSRSQTQTSPPTMMPHQMSAFFHSAACSPGAELGKIAKSAPQRWMKSVGLIRNMLSPYTGDFCWEPPNASSDKPEPGNLLPNLFWGQLPTVVKGQLNADEFGSHTTQVEKLQAKPPPPRAHQYNKVLHTQRWANLGIPSQVYFEGWK